MADDRDPREPSTESEWAGIETGDDDDMDFEVCFLASARCDVSGSRKGAFGLGIEGLWSSEANAVSPPIACKLDDE